LSKPLPNLIVSIFDLWTVKVDRRMMLNAKKEKKIDRKKKTPSRRDEVSSAIEETPKHKKLSTGRRGQVLPIETDVDVHSLETSFRNLPPD